MKSIDTRLASLMQREQERFVHDHPKSKALSKEDIDHGSRVFREAAKELAE